MLALLDDVGAGRSRRLSFGIVRKIRHLGTRRHGLAKDEPGRRPRRHSRMKLSALQSHRSPLHRAVKLVHIQMSLGVVVREETASRMTKKKRSVSLRGAQLVMRSQSSRAWSKVGPCSEVVAGERRRCDVRRWRKFGHTGRCRPSGGYAHGRLRTRGCDSVAINLQVEEREFALLARILHACAVSLEGI